MNKKSLSERDVCAKFITPSLVAAGWDLDTQIREEVGFTDGRIYVRGKIHARGAKKRVDHILYYKPNIPLAIIEAKDNNHTVGAGMQQALGYAKPLDVPFVFSSNGDAFLFHDKTVKSGPIETEIPLNAFPSPEQLWQKYKAFKGITDEVEAIVAQDYFTDGSNRSPRYYQQIAINRTVEAIACNEGNNRHLLVMATGTGKTYTAFQIIYRLWKSGVKKRILFLADRTSLIDQTVRGDFRHFKDAMTVIKHKQIDTAYNIYLALYQGLSDNNDADAYKQFSPEFFDLIIVDECHRGSAREDSKWREILEYFKGATHIGLTATPKETKEISSSEYFGDPLYTYSLKQGIEDGFLAPYKVVKVTLDIDADTGGFLRAAIDYIREKEVRTLDDEAILQKSITGWELKPVSYVLGLTNLILHGLDVPDWHYLDSLKTEYNSIGPKQQVECILANPPFGAGIADGVETNFPTSFRCRESADLFVILMIHLLKPGGRCAIVLPDGCITSDGYKERIREKLLTDCNLHTIIRLPQSTFLPATVSTNLLFFQKGTPTKEIWYWEHHLPEGQKSYSKTKAIQFDEFAPLIEWWDKREENEVAWKVKVEDLKKGFDLDLKNPHREEEEASFSTSEIIEKLLTSFDRSRDLIH